MPGEVNDTGTTTDGYSSNEYLAYTAALNTVFWRGYTTRESDLEDAYNLVSPKRKIILFSKPVDTASSSDGYDDKADREASRPRTLGCIRGCEQM